MIGKNYARAILSRDRRPYRPLTTQYPGNTVSQSIRKRIEETFAWGTMIGPLVFSSLLAVEIMNDQYAHGSRGI